MSGTKLYVSRELSKQIDEMQDLFMEKLGIKLPKVTISKIIALSIKTKTIIININAPQKTKDYWDVTI